MLSASSGEGGQCDSNILLLARSDSSRDSTYFSYVVNSVLISLLTVGLQVVRPGR